MVVSLGIFLIDEMGVIGADQLDAIFMGQLDEYLVSTLLQGERLAVGTLGRVLYFVTLQLQIVVVAKHAVIPFNGFTGAGNVSVKNFFGYLASNTGRTDYQAFMIAFQVFTVGTGTHVEAISPRT